MDLLLFLASTTLLLSLSIPIVSPQSAICRTSCAGIDIKYPLSIDDGCGSPYYRNMLTCSSDSTTLLLRTPSGSYPIQFISYADPHIVVSDPSMWTCHTDRPIIGKPPFSLDTSTRFSLSSKNDYLFFNCSEDSVIIRPRSAFCDRFPDRCDAACDSAAYLCRNMPGCPRALAERGLTCCAYNPRASESLRIMMKHCVAYTSVYWKPVASSFPPYDQVPEYGVRVDFEIPVTTRCLRCRDEKNGGGTCGFDTATRRFLCLCKDGNVTSYCSDGTLTHKTSTGVIAGTVTVVSVAGVVGAGAFVWYLKKMRNNKVTSGVQSNENRYF